MVWELNLEDDVGSSQASNIPTSSADQDTSSNFPVAAVAVSISLCVVSFLLLVLLCFVRRKRKKSKYKEYSPVAKQSIKPPDFPVKPGQKIINQQVVPRLPRDTLKIPQKVSSEESLAPLSSDDTYYDAEDNFEGRRSPSLSSREPSPSRAPAECESRYPPGHIGKIWFSVQYDEKKEILKVVLQKAVNLPSRSDSGIKCNPLVKISLLPQDKQIGQSRYKRKSTNPVYNEVFLVSLSSHQVERSSLCLTAVDWFRSNQQKQIGQIIYPLEEMAWNVDNDLEMDISPPKEESGEYGNIHISLSYYPTLHRLTIIILRATGIKGASRDTETFVKVSFSIGNKIMKTKRTAVHKETMSPMFNEAFNFTVNEDDLNNSTILVSLMRSGGAVMEDKLIGRILLGGRMYSRGRECDHWMEMMSNHRRMVKCWHELHA